MPDAGDNCRKCRYLGMTHSLSNGAFISVPGCRRRAGPRRCRMVISTGGPGKGLVRGV